jgi:hypothetical protein
MVQNEKVLAAISEILETAKSAVNGGAGQDDQGHRVYERSGKGTSTT